MKKRRYAAALTAVLMILNQTSAFAETEIYEAAADTDLGEVMAYAETVDYAVTGGSLLFDEKTGFVVGYNGEPASIEIPDTINGVKVIGIGGGAFEECETLTDVKISKNVKVIEKGAFSHCTKLESIELPPITKINDETFFFCTSLKNIDIPETVTEIGEKAFLRDYELVDVNMGDNVSNIGEMAFQECYKLKSVKLSKGIKTIGSSAFASDAKLYDITLPNGLEYIGGGAFYYCFCNNAEMQSDYELVIPDSVNYIGEYAFQGCQSIYHLKLPKGLNEINMGTFYFMTSLREIDIPDGVKTIGFDAFCDCKALGEVKLPANLEVIDERAFGLCTNLFEVKIPDGVKVINDYAFARANPGLSNKSLSNLTAVHIPASVTSMGDVFYNDNFDKLVLFVEKDSYAEKYAKANNIKYSNGEFVPYKTGSNTVYFDTGNGEVICADDSRFTDYDIPSQIEGVDVISIAAQAFEGQFYLKNVTIPNGVTKIGKQAFNNCLRLESAVIPVSVTEIGEYAFSGILDKNSFVIYVSPDSYAEQYAKYNEFNYEYISEEEPVYGDADGDNAITASDSAFVLQKALVSTFELPVQNGTENWLKYIDVDRDGNITASDSAFILQKALVSTFEFPEEK